MLACSVFLHDFEFYISCVEFPYWIIGSNQIEDFIYLFDVCIKLIIFWNVYVVNMIKWWTHTTFKMSALCTYYNHDKWDSSWVVQTIEMLVFVCINCNKSLCLNNIGY